jgi:hypothetical protein
MGRAPSPAAALYLYAASLSWAEVQANISTLSASFLSSSSVHPPPPPAAPLTFFI